MYDIISPFGRLRLYHKIMLIMRLTTVILIASLMQVSAASFGQRITLNKTNASLFSVLKDIRKQSGFDFYYEEKTNLKDQKISVSVSNATLEEALSTALRGLDLVYEIDGKIVSIKNKKMPSFLNRMAERWAAIDVRGKVLGENDEVLVGATVKIKGSGQVTKTNEKGEFFIVNVDENAILIISYLGYEIREIKAGAELNVVLIASSGKLEEVSVVSTGYQRISKERTAGSFAKPDMKVVNDRSTSMSILQRLDGQLAGLTVNNTPGAPAVVVRGISSISLSANPLYVVDGVPISDLASINPQDVADVTLLKDATAASIWGARAANGIIVITTKKGKAGDKLRIQYDAFLSFQGKPDLDYLPVVNSSQYIQAIKETFDPIAIPYSIAQTYGQSTGTGISSGIQPAYQYLYDHNRGLLTNAQLDSKLDSLSRIDNRGQIKDLFYRDAMLSNQTLSISGGGKSYSVYGSLAYTNTQSSKPTEKNDTYKINLRQDLNFGERIQAYLITDLTNNRTGSARPINVDYKFIPYQLFKDQNGNNIPMNYQGYLTEENRLAAQSKSLLDLSYNPLNEINAGFTKGDSFFARLTGGATLKLFDGLRYEGVYSYIYGGSKIRDYDGSNTYSVRAEAATFAQVVAGSTTPRYYLPTSGGRYAENTADQRNWTIRNSLVFDRQFEKHQITALAGLESQDQLNFNTISLTRGYDLNLQTSPAIDYLTLRNGISNYAVPALSPGSLNTLGVSSQPFSRTENEFRYTSYFTNIGYTFSGKYTLNASLRGDKSNLFGLDKSAQSRPIWSVGAKWLLSDEKFIPDNTWLSQLAIRATYGLAGNSPAPGSAASYNIFSAGSSAFFPNQTGLTLSSPANAKLTWESTKIYNLGLDFTVLDKRISGAIDYYHKKTFDLLGNMPVNPFTGYAIVMGNYGNMTNNGIDLSITSQNINSGPFNWTTTLNLAYNKNKITKLNNPTALTTGAQLISSAYATGYSAFSIFSYNYAGLNNIGDPTVRLADGSISSTYAALTPADIKYSGTYQPIVSGGLSNAFHYKGLRLTLNAIFNMGHVMRKDVSSFTYIGNSPSNFVRHEALPYLGGLGGGIYEIFLDRWKNPGDEAYTNVPGFVANTATSTARRGNVLQYWTFADLNVLDASYIKMRDITLAYTLPQSALSKIGIYGVTLRAQLSNLMLWRANKFGIDPEFQFSGVPGVSAGSRATPVNQETITFGLNISI
jgi:TonB-linked SusC/RagA family outer membrane protein